MKTKQSDKSDKNALKKDAIIENLANGNSIVKSCKLSTISHDTFYRWYKEDAAFRAGIDAAQQGRIKLVEDSLYITALKGNTTAMIFYLCNRCPENWKNLNETKFSGKVGFAVSFDKQDEKL
jgi:transposase-like protein